MTHILVSLRHIANFLGHSNWSKLDNDQIYKKFKSNIKHAHYSISTTSKIGTGISTLKALGLINREPKPNEFSGLGCQSKSDYQAIAIPVNIYQTIITDALRTVEQFHKYRHEISKVMEQAYDIRERVHNGEAFIAKKTKAALSTESANVASRVRNAVNRIEHDIEGFDVVMNGSVLARIQTSCFIVVLAFSGIRLGEACSLNKKSYSTENVDGKTVGILRGETTKGNSGKPKTKVWQAHYAVKDALELAYDMLASARKIYKKRVKNNQLSGDYSTTQIKHQLRQLESSFIVPNPIDQKSDNFIFTGARNAINKHLKSLKLSITHDDISDFDMLNPRRVGTMTLSNGLPKLSPHDFRRSFAVFHVRYGFGTSVGIKFQYGHATLQMSDYYANNAVLAKANDLLMDSDLLDEFKEAGIELGVDLYDDAYNKTRHLSGHQGELIQKNKLQKLEEGFDVYMSRDEIEEHVRNGDFSIVQLPTGGYCTNPSCDRVCGSKSFRAEIKECTHQLFTDDGAKKLAKQRLRLIEQFRGFNNGDGLRKSILAGLQQKIKVSEITLRKHHISFTPFIDKITKELDKASINAPNIG
ncbi:hypothetical protein BCU00_004120 [Vibrio breoganii]|uniref:hypothetical protein n=1 Tax=Vibrio breoganii TaxID=553239 RepID=UPI0039A51564